MNSGIPSLDYNSVPNNTENRIVGVTTRSQSNKNIQIQPTNREILTENQLNHIAPIETKPLETTGKTNTTDVLLSKKDPITNTETIKELTVNMTDNIAEIINRKIVTFIPEFSGSNQEDVAKFLNCAEWTRKQLNNDEKEIFDELIMHRLSGNAYRKISKKSITDFESLATALNNIYCTTTSLEELYESCFSCTQLYSESTRQYGHRLVELLEEYTDGYSTKYQSPPDQTHITYLNDKAVQTFKNGLNNTILRDKVSTIRAKTLPEIINETEITEKMLKASKPIPHNTYTPEIQQQSNIANPILHHQLPTQLPTPIICNYCNKPHHTWSECRTRKAQQTTTNKQNYSNNPTYRRNSAQEYIKSCSHCKIMGHDIMECRSKKTEYNNFNQTQRNLVSPQTNQQFNNYNYNKNPRAQQTKWCNYCKRTGHDLEECRSKPQNPPNNFNRTTQDRTLTNDGKIFNNYQRQSPNKYTYGLNDQTCSYCKRRGHHISECNTKRNADNNTHNQMNNLENEFNKLNIYNVEKENEPVNYQNYPPYMKSENSRGSDE